ncbi:MAG: phosphatidylserine decarboxylase [Proteobacteria bacterium]|nr:phosphatidylserine decarboxylase [Pseudomonadota bacterium]
MRVRLLICILLGMLSASCGAPPAPPAPPLPEPSQILGAAEELQKLVAADPELKRLLEKAIEEGRKLNPDPETNPAQTLEQYYQFVRFAEGATPANLIKHAPDATLYKRIDQSLGYLYFIPTSRWMSSRAAAFQQLAAVRGFLQLVAAGVREIMGLYLDQPESWNAGMLQLAREDPVFGLKRGWYESPDNWKSFNQFFARRLASPDKRPIAAPDDDAVVVSPVDAVPMGTWSVGDDLKLVATEGVAVKTATVESVEALLDGSPYASAFAGGTFTHLFLDVGDYHRYHFPMTGTIWEIRVIPGRELSGGFTTWDAANRRYSFDPSSVGWQSLETRGLIVLQTDKFGLVALMPIGMSPVSSINFEKPLEEGRKVQKGDPMGHFLFGGSDFIVVFQKGVKVTLETPKNASGKGYRHVLMGERVARLSGAPR